MSIKYKVLFILRGFCSFPTWSENLAPWHRRLFCVRVPLHKKLLKVLKTIFPPKKSVASLKSNLPALAGRLQCILPLHLIWTWAKFRVGRNYRNFIWDRKSVLMSGQGFIATNGDGREITCVSTVCQQQRWSRGGTREVPSLLENRKPIPNPKAGWSIRWKYWCFYVAVT